MQTRAIKAVLAAFAVAAVAATPAGAAAGGAGTETLTEHFHETLLFSESVSNPCTGEPGMLSATATNGVFHLTTQADGDAWVTGTVEGIVTFVPEEPGAAQASGHFTSWFGEELNNKNHVEHDTSTFILKGSDGSHVVLKMKGHLGTNANGAVTVEFHRESLHCG
jgi:hypothetical protein